jgi:hypothetical protein
MCLAKEPVMTTEEMENQVLFLTNMLRSMTTTQI